MVLFNIENLSDAEVPRCIDETYLTLEALVKRQQEFNTNKKRPRNHNIDFLNPELVQKKLEAQSKPSKVDAEDGPKLFDDVYKFHPEPISSDVMAILLDERPKGFFQQVQHVTELSTEALDDLLNRQVISGNDAIQELDKYFDNTKSLYEEMNTVVERMTHNKGLTPQQFVRELISLRSLTVNMTRAYFNIEDHFHELVEVTKQMTDTTRQLFRECDASRLETAFLKDDHKRMRGAVIDTILIARKKYFEMQNAEMAKRRLEQQYEPTEDSTVVVMCDVPSAKLGWEENMELTSHAMEIYMRALRELVKNFHGYITMTERDSCQILFKNTLDAVNFANGLHTKLMAEEWSEEVEKMYPFREVVHDEVVWFRGVRVRIGIHIGSCDLHKHNDRYQKVIGPTAELARKVLFIGKEGETLITSDAASKMRMADRLAGCSSFLNAGSIQTESGSSQECYVFYPKQYAGRHTVIHEILPHSVKEKELIAKAKKADQQAAKQAQATGEKEQLQSELRAAQKEKVALTQELKKANEEYSQALNQIHMMRKELEQLRQIATSKIGTVGGGYSSPVIPGSPVASTLNAGGPTFAQTTQPQPPEPHGGGEGDILETSDLDKSPDEDPSLGRPAFIPLSFKFNSAKLSTAPNIELVDIPPREPEPLAGLDTQAIVKETTKEVPTSSKSSKPQASPRHTPSTRPLSSKNVRQPAMSPRDLSASPNHVAQNSRSQSGNSKSPRGKTGKDRKDPKEPAPNNFTPSTTSLNPSATPPSPQVLDLMNTTHSSPSTNSLVPSPRGPMATPIESRRNTLPPVNEGSSDPPPPPQVQIPRLSHSGFDSMVESLSEMPLPDARNEDEGEDVVNEITISLPPMIEGQEGQKADAGQLKSAPIAAPMKKRNTVVVLGSTPEEANETEGAPKQQQQRRHSCPTPHVSTEDDLVSTATATVLSVDVPVEEEVFSQSILYSMHVPEHEFEARDVSMQTEADPQFLLQAHQWVRRFYYIAQYLLEDVNMNVSLEWVELSQAQCAEAMKRFEQHHSLLQQEDTDLMNPKISTTKKEQIGAHRKAREDAYLGWVTSEYEKRFQDCMASALEVTELELDHADESDRMLGSLKGLLGKLLVFVQTILKQESAKFPKTQRKISFDDSVPGTAMRKVPVALPKGRLSYDATSDATKSSSNNTSPTKSAATRRTSNTVAKSPKNQTTKSSQQQDQHQQTPSTPSMMVGGSTSRSTTKIATTPLSKGGADVPTVADAQATKKRASVVDIRKPNPHHAEADPEEAKKKEIQLEREQQVATSKLNSVRDTVSKAQRRIEEIKRDAEASRISKELKKMEEEEKKALEERMMIKDKPSRGGVSGSVAGKQSEPVFGTLGKRVGKGGRLHLLESRTSLSPHSEQRPGSRPSVKDTMPEEVEWNAQALHQGGTSLPAIRTTPSVPHTPELVPPTTQALNNVNNNTSITNEPETSLDPTSGAMVPVETSLEVYQQVVQTLSQVEAEIVNAMRRGPSAATKPAIKGPANAPTTTFNLSTPLQPGGLMGPLHLVAEHKASQKTMHPPVITQVRSTSVQKLGAGFVPRSECMSAGTAQAKVEPPVWGSRPGTPPEDDPSPSYYKVNVVANSAHGYFPVRKPQNFWENSKVDVVGKRRLVLHELIEKRERETGTPEDVYVPSHPIDKVYHSYASMPTRQSQTYSYSRDPRVTTPPEHS